VIPLVVQEGLAITTVPEGSQQRLEKEGLLADTDIDMVIKYIAGQGVLDLPCIKNTAAISTRQGTRRNEYFSKLFTQQALVFLRYSANNHHCLYVVDTKHKTIEYYDSLYNHNAPSCVMIHNELSEFLDPYSHQRPSMVNVITKPQQVLLCVFLFCTTYLTFLSDK
jgi:hypothetical protein